MVINTSKPSSWFFWVQVQAQVDMHTLQVAVCGASYLVKQLSVDSNGPLLLGHLTSDESEERTELWWAKLLVVYHYLQRHHTSHNIE